jgi:predicted transcriptional regulator of viral defense system
MASLNQYLDDLLTRGLDYFSREAAMQALGLSSAAFAAAVTRLKKKRRLANPRHGFYLILRPEDRVAGASDPLRWIDPLMKHQRIEYRISLLRAAAFHGSSHQAAMVFQVIVPKQLRAFQLGRHKLQFIYQTPNAFAEVNPGWTLQVKSDTGFATVAGVELTLLDCARYFHRAGGINGVAQIAKDLGARADPRALAAAAVFYENSSVRRLGYLLDLSGHEGPASALQEFAIKTNSVKPLDPSVKVLSAALRAFHQKNSKWKLEINVPVEFES